MNDGLELMRARLNVRGGIKQQDRMIADKRKNLKNVILYSYQGAKVQKTDGSEGLALINPNTVKQDYDDKVISIDFDYNFQVGTIFNWVGTNTHWLIYLQDLTELAYFKGDIRRCNYEIKWRNEKGDLCSTYAAIIGPSEKSLSTESVNNLQMDVPNHSINLLLPKTQEILDYFKRYTEFYLQEDTSICWRVEAIDTISNPGILEVAAVEYYNNKDEDADGLVGELIVEPITPEPTTAEIEGEVFIKPKRTYNYKYIGDSEGSWSWDKKLPIVTTIKEDGSIDVKWTVTYNGQFELSFGEVTKTIVVESLF